MIVKDAHITDYLEAFHAGRIAKGLGIGCVLDDFIRWKPGTFNVILGHDNLGKTYWRMWYYLCLSVKHGNRWCVWTGENHSGQIVRDLIQQYTGRRFKDLSIAEVHRYNQEVRQWFTFVDNSKVYEYKDLLNIFEEGYSGCLIDPYTGLKRKYTHEANYDFLNETREWVNRTGISLDICTHPVSSSGRGAESYFPKGHEWEGGLKPPKKDDAEGGKPFANRCDDFYCVHRLADLPSMKNYTLIHVYKVKDVETGGQRTMKESPIMLEFNYGLGFKIEGVDPLRQEYIKPVEGYEAKPLPVNRNFYEPIKDEDIPF